MPIEDPCRTLQHTGRFRSVAQVVTCNFTSPYTINPTLSAIGDSNRYSVYGCVKRIREDAVRAGTKLFSYSSVDTVGALYVIDI